MKCKHCNSELSTTLGSRPVLMCRHSLCETCAADLKCPICGVTSDETLDALIDQDALETLEEVENWRGASSSNSNLNFKCSEHPTSDIAFCCLLHKDMLCSQCAWPHIFDHKDSVVPYVRSDVAMDLAKCRDVIQNVENECMDLKKAIDNVNTTKLEKGGLFELLDKSLKFAESFGEDMSSSKLRGKTGLPFESDVAKTEDEQQIINSFIPASKGKIQLSILYRLTRDGADICSFRSNWANKGATVMLFHSRNGKKIGVYLETSWRNDDKPETGSSANFIFTLNPVNKLYGDPAKPAHQTQNYINSPESIVIGGSDLVIRLRNPRSLVTANPGSAFGEGQKQKLEFFNDLKQFTFDELEVFKVYTK